MPEIPQQLPTPNALFYYVLSVLFGVALLVILKIIVTKFVKKVEDFMDYSNKRHDASEDAITEIANEQELFKKDFDHQNKLTEMRLKSLDQLYDGEKIADVIIQKLRVASGEDTKPKNHGHH